MKKIKNFTLGIFLLTTLSLGISSCSTNDESIGKETNENLSTGLKSNSSTYSDMKDIVEGYGGTINFNSNIDPKNAYYFDTITDFKDFFSGLHNSTLNPVIANPVDQNSPMGCADGIYRGSVGAGMGTLNFYLTVSGGKISNVSSSLTGFTLGIGWSQDAVSISGNTATISGTFTGNLFLEGLGAIWSSGATFKVNLGC